MSSEPLTVTYKRRGDLNILSDVWQPESGPTPNGDKITVPAVVFFHGADYSLIPPATGHDIVEDIKDLWSFILDPHNIFSFVNGGTQKDFVVQPDKIVVAGTSAGGLCAYLCAMHCVDPPPVALLSIYGMGGDFFVSYTFAVRYCMVIDDTLARQTPHYLHEKHAPFFRGRELLDPSEFQEFVYPFQEGDSTFVSDSPLSHHPPTHPIPGYPSNPRMLLARLYLQLGQFLDYYTGQHSPSLSRQLREIYDSYHQEHTQPSTLKGASPPLDGGDDDSSRLWEAIESCLGQHRNLFPQVNVVKGEGRWPRTVFLHGTADTAVPIGESRSMESQLKAIGVPTQLFEVEEEEHSFDLVPNAEERFGVIFDKVTAFLHGVE
ncbi:hypothetical protein CC1G_03342 [Coprinopsis cinerea okayama7|uniref:Alpha/beta-hydrolase n=1 Tax=Coprinopsis cinerea (strain Okayama-7 / 130 / ATCC MYA-4618 / FGSC 9003) TaxID=240176 RepID=A8NQW5_COPC7|nr:hypothetical protein CC1G_03342 [Coprinopsis cinerea okayama7\|eukprot:XP_001835560.2 hypothetical protein CC1G_03342 [Coprinopsis cinerea okayama7\